MRSEEHYVSCLGKTIDDLYEEDLPEVITWYLPLSYMTLYLAYPPSGKDAEDITLVIDYSVKLKRRIK